MSRAKRLRACAILMTLTPSLLRPASLPVPAWFERRLYPDIVQAREVQGIPDRIVEGKLSLTVKSFLELVLKNSTAVNLVRLNVYGVSASILATKAPYDPTTSLGFNTFRSVSPSVSQISGASTLSTLTQNSTVQYQQLLSTGQTVSAGYTASRDSNNSAFNLLNPSIFSTFSFTAFQPLLQDRSRIQVRGPLEIARTQLTITSKQSEAQIADLLATAAVNYWQAVEMRDSVKVYQQTLDLAQKSYARDKQALDLGALVSGGLGKLLLGVGEDIGVEAELRLENIEVVAGGFTAGVCLRGRGGLARRRVLGLEALERGLIAVDDLLKLGNFLGERQRIAGEFAVLDACFAECGCKRLVDLVVGEALGFMRKSDLFCADGERGERLRGLPWALIHQTSVCRSVAGMAADRLQVRHGVAGHPGKHSGGDEDREQNRQRDQSRLPSMPIARDFRGFGCGGRVGHDSILTGKVAAST